MTQGRHLRLLFATAAAALLVLAAPSTASLWIDEAATARLAAKPTLAEWSADMLGGRYSEHQMPLSMFVAWLGGQTLGTSEWQLRVVNILWGMAAVGAAFLIGRRMELPGLPLLFALHPFFVAYMNEARPYAMQIAAGAWLLYGLLDFIDHKGGELRWPWAFALGGITLCGSSLLGVIPFAAVSTVMGFLAIRHGCKIEMKAWIIVAGTLALLFPLGLFYLWTLSREAGGARLWSVGVGNVVFALYELGGFTGLGPSRIQLREIALLPRAEASRLVAPFLPGLLCLSGSYLIVLSSLWRRRAEEMKLPLRATLAAAVLMSGMLILLAWTVRWPFWGRHLAAAFPFFILPLAMAVRAAWHARVLGRGAVVALILLLAVSSASLRFGAMHARDDYRAAAAIAREAMLENQRVWWLADRSAAVYYGVPLAALGSFDHFTPGELRAAPPPDLVILSKPDVYDSTGMIRAYLREARFEMVQTLPAFTIWRNTEGLGLAQ